MSEGLPLREEVPVKETWDLKDLFTSDQAFYQTLEQVVQMSLDFNHTYYQKLNNIETIEKALDEYERILIEIDRLYNYPELRLSVDTSNEEAQKVNAKLNTTSGKLAGLLSFVDSEILELPDEIISELRSQTKYPHFIKQLQDRKPYQLSADVEKVLATLTPTLRSPFELYGTTKSLDINFESFDYEGVTYPLDYATFENEYEDHPSPEFRRKSFRAFSDALRQYQHTTAATYNMQVQQEKIEADLRGYDSVIDYLLQDQEVTKDMFDRQIDVIMSDLAPVMQKYAKIIQRVHNLDKMRFEDLKISIDPNFEPEISIEESKKYIYGALKVLGDDYVKMLESAYDYRWIDFAQNKGKDTGAYCASPYITHSYVFISWTGKMAETFVLAHELGHVEAPSTMNEMLMANYLFNSSNNPRFKRWVIGSILSRTYYHNMVTHLLEAAYQREVYSRVDNGESLTAPLLNEIMLNTYKAFFGDTVEMTDGVELTWMRQPHYYMGLYSYTYSAGLTIGTVVSQCIKKEGQPAVDRWLKTLQAGGSQSPIELAQIAGVDITTDAPLKETINYISNLVDELEVLTYQIKENS